MITLLQIARSVQALFGTHADQAAADSNVILRHRKFTPSGLAATFVLGHLHNPHARDEDLARMAAANGEAVTTQAIEQRYHPRMVTFLRRLFERAVQERVTSTCHFGPLLERFTDVQILDSTTLTLPDELAAEFPGCGGRRGGAAALKLQLRLSLKTGAIGAVAIEAGRDCDQKTPLQQDVLPAGSLRLADLGYFDGEVLDRIEHAGAFWISPWMTGLTLHDAEGQRVELLDWLERQGPVFDGAIRFGAEQRPARMLAWKLPAAVAARRRQKVRAQAKRKGVPPSQARLDRCDWAILITNLPAEKLTIDEARVLYRSRWQIELLFKRWKSQGRIGELTGRTLDRCLVQLWSRLLAAILQQWLQCGVWGRVAMSLKKVWDAVRSGAILLAGSWRDATELQRSVERLLATVELAARQNPRKSRSTFEMLHDPSKITYRVEPLPTA